MHMEFRDPRRNRSPPDERRHSSISGDGVSARNATAAPVSGAGAGATSRAASRDPFRLRACRAPSCPWRGRPRASPCPSSSRVAAAPACGPCARRRRPAGRARARCSSSLRVRVGSATTCVEVVDKRREVRTEQPGLAVLDDHVGLGDLRRARRRLLTSQPCSARPASVRLLDEVVVPRALVERDRGIRLVLERRHGVAHCTSRA